jgi:hypothetical protein
MYRQATTKAQKNDVGFHFNMAQKCVAVSEEG